VPASKPAYDKLWQKETHNEAENAKGELQKLNTDGAEYVASNLHRIFAQEAKSQAAGT
jgi:hypothetical protein